MQTFLPLPSFASSAQVLDRQRLGNQRNEAKVLLRILLGELPNSTWRAHPACLMWRGYEGALARYGIVICRTWRRRGYRDSLLPWFRARARMINDGAQPWWLGWEELHSSHRGALLWKNPEWYRQFGWTEEPKMAYAWPEGAPVGNDEHARADQARRHSQRP